MNDSTHLIQNYNEEHETRVTSLNSVGIFDFKQFFWNFQRIRRFWEYFILGVAFIAPFEFTFIIVVQSDISLLHYLPFFIPDILFGIDNWVLRRTVTFKNGNPVTNKQEIINVYGKKRLYMHLFSCIPLGWIGIVSRNIYAYSILSIPKLLRLYRAYNAWSTIRTHLAYFGSIWTMLPFFYMIVFIIHMFSVFFIVLAKMEGREKSWLYEYDKKEYSSSQIYVVAVYFVMTTISTVGYGDILPRTTPETIVLIFIQITGVIFHAFITSNLVKLLIDPLSSDFIMHYKVSQDFLRFKKVDRSLRREVRHFSQYRWETTRAAGGIRTLLKQFPPTLRAQLKLELTERYFKQTLIFSNIKTKYLLKVAGQLSHAIFSPTDYLVHQDEYCDCLFFIGRGITQVVVDEQPVATQDCNDNVVLCERQLLLKSRVANSIRALTYVDVWVLSRDSISFLMRRSRTLASHIIANLEKTFPAVMQSILYNLFGDEWKQYVIYLSDNKRVEKPTFEQHIPQIRKNKDSVPRIALKGVMSIPEMLKSYKRKSVEYKRVPRNFIVKKRASSVPSGVGVVPLIEDYNKVISFFPRSASKSVLDQSNENTSKSQESAETSEDMPILVFDTSLSSKQSQSAPKQGTNSKTSKRKPISIRRNKDGDTNNRGRTVLRPSSVTKPSQDSPSPTPNTQSILRTQPPSAHSPANHPSVSFTERYIHANDDSVIPHTGHRSLISENDLVMRSQLTLHRRKTTGPNIFRIKPGNI